MDRTVYWFMLPACILIASVAMFSGISGAALLTPTFLIGFPLFGVPRLTTLAATATSLFLESSGFGTGLYRYLKLRLVDDKTARSMILITLPSGALGSIVALFVPVLILKIGYGVADFCAHGLRLQRVLSGGGAVLAGMISTGVGEATLPALVRRSRFPVPVAAATSTVIVASTVVGAAATHLLELLAEGGVGAIPWNLIVWAVPGSVIGAFVGTRLQGRISERASRLFFAAIGLAFLLAFTVYAHRFA